MWRRVRGLAVLLCVALLLASAVTVFEPHRRVTAGQSEYFVSEDISPSAQWSHTRLNTRQVAHTMVVRTYAPAANDTLLSKRVSRYDPQSRQVRSALYYRSGEQWSTSHVYFGEQVKATTVGEATAPRRGAVTDVFEPQSKPRYNAFARAKRDYLDAHVATYALKTLNTTSEHLVVGVTTADGYSDFKKLDDGRIRNRSSYRAYIDVETGRVRRIVDIRRYRTPDNETQSVRKVIRVTDYGNTTVTRPDWSSWRPMELVYDALSL